jgi:murein L,D-transpeptidase YafK
MRKYITYYIIAGIILFLVLPVQSADTYLLDVQADYLLVEKSLKRLTLFTDEIPIKAYDVALGRNPVGPKLSEGDRRTPEGRYVIDARNQDSKYHLSLHISYPNAVDLEITGLAGVNPGSNIMIHGTGDEYAWMGKFHDVLDWTDGCIAVTNDEIEEIWQLVPDGTPIEIRP